MGILSGITDTLFGSSPKVKSDAQNTMTPEQQQLLKTLTQQYGNKAALPHGGAPVGAVSPLEHTSLAGLEQYAMGIAGGGTSGTGANKQAGALNTSAISALQGIFNQGPTDFNNYFDTSIAAPAETNFADNILPAVRRAYAGAGGTGGEGEKQVTLATKNIIDSLTQQRAALGYQTSLDDRTAKLNAAQLTGGVTSNPLNQLLAALGAGGTTRNIQQQNFSNQVTQQQLMQSILGQHAFENVNQVLPGTTGIVPSFINAVGGGVGKAAGAAMF